MTPWRMMLLVAAALLNSGSATANQPSPLVAFTVTGDGINQPLAAKVGDAKRGAAIVADRQVGLCVLCHAVPGDPSTSNIAKSLNGVGSRLSAAQMRLRIVDSRQIDANSVMPAYYRLEGLTRVGAHWRARTILDAQQIEDVVAFLLTLRQ